MPPALILASRLIELMNDSGLDLQTKWAAFRLVGVILEDETRIQTVAQMQQQQAPRE